MDNLKDLELIYEANCLRFIPRVWVQMMNPNFSNLAEHHLRVIWLSLLLARHENAGDHEKIMKMALIHDLPESRTGDAHYISRIYTKRDEKQAMKDILSGTSFEQEFLTLYAEYEQRDSIEAKIVKDADTLDVDIELHEQAENGVTLESRWRKWRQAHVYPRLYTESAKKIWKAIGESDPHSWHLHAKNRHNSGDWSLPLN